MVEQACVRLLRTSARDVTRLTLTPKAGVYRVTLADGRSVVIKLYAPARSFTAFTERDLIRAVSGHVATPTVLACGTVPPHGATVLITGDLGETTLGQAVRDESVSEREAMHRCGRILARLHQVPVTPGLLTRRSLAQQCVHLRRVGPPALLHRIRPALDRVEAACDRLAQLVLCHGDLHLDNVLLPECGPSAGTAHLVDFEETTHCVMEYDLAQTLVTCDATTGAARDHLLTAYGTSAAEGLLDALIVFHTARGWTYAALLENRDRDLWAARLDHTLAAFAHVLHPLQKGH
ncbi:phosphotransferase enzyme family protein [Streptomyces sp. NPDC002144]